MASKVSFGVRVVPSVSSLVMEVAFVRASCRATVSRPGKAPIVKRSHLPVWMRYSL